MQPDSIYKVCRVSVIYFIDTFNFSRKEWDKEKILGETFCRHIRNGKCWNNLLI